MDVQLTCPLRSLATEHDVISWFRPTSPSALVNHHRLLLISIGDLLLPDYASLTRFNLLSSPSRLTINQVLLEDQGFYKCKSNSHGQHTIELIIQARPHLSSPVVSNGTWSIICSLSCHLHIDFSQFQWIVDGQLIHLKQQHRERIHIETFTSNSQRLILLTSPTNVTCRYEKNESTYVARRRLPPNKDELSRYPRQQISIDDLLNSSSRSLCVSMLVFHFVLVRFILLQFFSSMPLMCN